MTPTPGTLTTIGSVISACVERIDGSEDRERFAGLINRSDLIETLATVFAEQDEKIADLLRRNGLLEGAKQLGDLIIASLREQSEERLDANDVAHGLFVQRLQADHKVEIARLTDELRLLRAEHEAALQMMTRRGEGDTAAAVDRLYAWEHAVTAVEAFRKERAG